MEIVNVRRATGEIVDVGQFYDPRFYDNVEVADGTTALFERGKTYKLDASGKVVERPRLTSEPVVRFGWLNADQDFAPYKASSLEIIYVLEGQLRVDEKDVRQTVLARGQSLLVSKGTEYRLTGALNNTLFVVMAR